MPEIGQTISHYRIVEKIGQGGMGEVYLADDTTLDRKVALKFLPEAFTSDPERMARFEREAKLLASLNHSNIAGIYGLETADDNRFLVLEYVEGETLQARLSKGALPLEDALTLCRQIAEGLEAAHEKGVIHRDLKPANVMITAEEKVKILDFGLAKALSDDTQNIDTSQSPTLTEAMTQPGVILGTAAYMSPEQAKGKSVDKRADIWAFGCILYECLTGKKAFEGETVTETLASVLTKEPEWNKAPVKAHAALLRCLEKDPKKRLRDIGEAMAWFESAPFFVPEPTRVKKLWLPWMITAVFFITAIGVLLWGLRASQSLLQEPVNLLVELPAGTHLAVETEHPTLTLSPNGSELFFVAVKDGIRQLYRRRLADLDAVAIEGTEDAASPFFSPDGKWIAFFQNNTLKKVSLSGGIPETIFPTVTPIAVNRGASWGSGNSIILSGSPNDGLHRLPISSDGVTGPRFRETPKPTAGGHAWPEALPGGEDILFANYTALDATEPNVAISSSDTNDIKSLVPVGTNPRYSATGHLLYARGRSLFGVPFSKETRQILGSEFKLADGLITGVNGSAQFAVSDNGTLAYVTGQSSTGECELVWVDRKGQVEILLDNGRQFKTPMLSPDGSQLAVMSPTGSNYDIWVFNLSRGDFTPWTTHPGEDFRPVWNLNGGFAYASEIGEDEGEGGPGLALMAGKHSKPERLLKTPGDTEWEMPSSWSPDGKWLAFTAYRNFKTDIYLLEADTREIKPFLDTSSNEYAAKFSPEDGRWIAYVSDLSGSNEVYVSPFSNPEDYIPISTNGGTEPIWNHNGRELFYRERNRLMAVKITGSSRLNPGQPQPLFPDSYERNDFGYGEDANYDVSLDGSRFLMIRRKNPEMPTLIHIVLNWPEAMKVSEGKLVGVK